MIAEDEVPNFDIFLDCLSAALITKLTQPRAKPKKRRGSKVGNKTDKPLDEVESDSKDGQNAEDLKEFVEVLCTETAMLW